MPVKEFPRQFSAANRSKILSDFGLRSAPKAIRFQPRFLAIFEREKRAPKYAEGIGKSGSIFVFYFASVLGRETEQDGVAKLL